MIIGKMRMKTSQQDNAQQWIESWERASVALKAIKRHELRTYDYAKNQAIVDGMCNGLLNVERYDWIADWSNNNVSS